VDEAQCRARDHLRACNVVCQNIHPGGIPPLVQCDHLVTLVLLAWDRSFVLRLLEPCASVSKLQLSVWRGALGLGHDHRQQTGADSAFGHGSC
jgi:hypothetical protein